MSTEQPIASEDGIVSLTSLDEVGQAVTLRYPRVKEVLLGRISHFGGTDFDGFFPVIHAFTPAGTKFHAGRVWMRPPTPTELENLAGFERDAFLDGCPKDYWDTEAWREAGLFRAKITPPTKAAEFAFRQTNFRLDALDEIEEKYLELLEVLLVLGGNHTFEEAHKAVREEWAQWLAELDWLPPLAQHLTKHTPEPELIERLKRLRAGNSMRVPRRKKKDPT